MSLGTRLKELRKENNVQAVEIAKHLQIAKSTYSGYENDKSKPDYDTLRALAKFFSVSIDYLLGETNIKTPINTLAFHATEPLTEDELEEVKQYIEFLKSKRK